MYGNLVLRFFSFKCYFVAKTKHLLFMRFAQYVIDRKEAIIGKAFSM